MEGTKLTQDVPSIKTAILAKLTAAVGLASIKTWLKAEPAPARHPTSPFGIVEWAGGPRNPEAGTKRIVDNFYVVIVKKSADADGNEDAVIALCKSAEAALEADPELNSTTFDSWVSNREVQKVPAGDYEIAAVRITLTTWRLA